MESLNLNLRSVAGLASVPVDVNVNLLALLSSVIGSYSYWTYRSSGIKWCVAQRGNELSTSPNVVAKFLINNNKHAPANNFIATHSHVCSDLFSSNNQTKKQPRFFQGRCTTPRLLPPAQNILPRFKPMAM